MRRLRESEPLFVDVGEPPVAEPPFGVFKSATRATSRSPRDERRRASRSATARSASQSSFAARATCPGHARDPRDSGAGMAGAADEGQPRARCTADRFGGTRTFSYVVRIHPAKARSISARCASPTTTRQVRRYEVARASLGIVQVTKAEPLHTTPAPTSRSPLLAGISRARDGALEGQARGLVPHRSGRPYWGALFGAPLACVLEHRRSRAAARTRDASGAPTPLPPRTASRVKRRSEAEAAPPQGRRAPGRRRRNRARPGGRGARPAPT